MDRLSALESGDEEPTRPTLVKMAKQYRRPLLAFYLSKPPRKGDRGADFRTLANQPSPVENSLLDALIRDIQARHNMVRTVLEEEDEADILPFVGSVRIEDGLRMVSGALKNLLDVSDDQYRAQPNVESAFHLLRGSAGRAGVFTLLKGDLGSYHTALDTEMFRGFAIADEIAPFVVINDKDATAAWSFTLLHELTHILLGQTGIGDSAADSDIERFCDNVAGEFLLPETEAQLLDISSAMSFNEKVGRVEEFARERNLSRAMVAYNTYRLGEIEQKEYITLSKYFRQRWQKERATQRERARISDGGPNYYVIRRHRIGNDLIALTRRMMDSGALTTSKAAKILGVKPTQVQRLLDIGL